jgi:transposase
MLKRRKFSAEFKRGAVEQACQPGVSCVQVARELGMRDNLLTRWKREAQSQGKGKGKGKVVFGGTGIPRDEELALLKRELARGKKERDFLREAAMLFAKASS